METGAKTRRVVVCGKAGVCKGLREPDGASSAVARVASAFRFSRCVGKKRRKRDGQEWPSSTLWIEEPAMKPLSALEVTAALFVGLGLSLTPASAAEPNPQYELGDIKIATASATSPRTAAGRSARSRLPKRGARETARLD